MYYLYKIYPDGRVSNLARGVQRLNHVKALPENQTYRVYKGAINHHYIGTYRVDKVREKLVRVSDFMAEFNQAFFSDF